jgi:hypothetical protein
MPVGWIVLMVYGAPGAASLLVLAPKLIGGLKLLRVRKRAWGWGLAAGIVGCMELWMAFPFCVPIVAPLAAGIFTIVILSLTHVRRYLAARIAAQS